VAVCTHGKLATAQRVRKGLGPPRTAGRVHSATLRLRWRKRADGRQPGPRRSGPRAHRHANAPGLAVRAVVRAAPSLDDALDGRSAVRARLAFAVVDEEDVLAAFLHVGDRLRRILALQGRPEGLPDRTSQPGRLLG